MPISVFLVPMSMAIYACMKEARGGSSLLRDGWHTSYCRRRALAQRAVLGGSVCKLNDWGLACWCCGVLVGVVCLIIVSWVWCAWLLWLVGVFVCLLFTRFTSSSAEATWTWDSASLGTSWQGLNSKTGWQDFVDIMMCSLIVICWEMCWWPNHPLWNISMCGHAVRMSLCGHGRRKLSRCSWIRLISFLVACLIFHMVLHL